MRPYIVGITGASGVIYGIRLVQVLAELGYEIAFVISRAGYLVIQEELNPLTQPSPSQGERDRVRGASVKESIQSFFEPKHLERITLYSNEDLTAPIASGSYPTQGMVIIPCSTGTLGCVAHGISSHLIHRAAECTLKEGRRLVVVPRETPMSVIQLENLLKLARAGVRILPASPAFYSGARKIQDLVDFVVGKVLDALEIAHTLYPRWIGKTLKVEGWSEG